jgi:UDP-2,3-diacylglucosamine pyrophosphatase LpxH
MVGKQRHNLLALSDLHLGCDVRAESPRGDRRRDALDLAIIGFLDQHAAERSGGRPWRLLLLGDIFDFVAVTALPSPRLAAAFALAEEERRFGLAAEDARCVWKLRLIAARHDALFRALARFVVAGNEVRFVRGNHDAEVQLSGVQDELRRLIGRRSGLKGPARAAVEARIRFHDWFYLEPGTLYAEHGNAHDRYCLQSGFFQEAPAPGAPMELPMSSKVLRFFAAHWTGDQGELDKADQWGVLDYLRWAARMGNPLHLVGDFFGMVARILGSVAWVDRRKGDDERIHLVHRWLSAFTEPGLREVKGLAALATQPAEHSVLDALQLFYLDRLVLLLVTAGAAIGCAITWPLPAALGAGALLAASFALANRALAARRACEAHPLLVTAARRLAELFPVRTIVMGHSHQAAEVQVGAGTRYLNLGAWTPQESALPFLRMVDGDAQLGRFSPPPAKLAAQKVG